MVLDQLAAFPGMERLRALARTRGGGLWLVGGAIRDIALGRPPLDLDVAVEGDPLPVARELGDVVEAHDRFGTADVALAAGGRVNLASTRTESYGRPGALPTVTVGATIEEDLRRRDFTVNAIAVALDDGREIAFPGARDDLAARRLRVLHNRSFVDDPTRAYRLARYAARLGLEIDPETERLAGQADPTTVSDDRIANEVRLLLGEEDPLAALRAAAELLRDGAVPPVDVDRARAALPLLHDHAQTDLLLVASSLDPDDAAAWARRLGNPQSVIARVRRAAEAQEVARALRAATRPSEIAAVARREPPEALVLAATLGAAEPVQAWIDELRHVELHITGADLLAAGVRQGPEIGERLARALDARLDRRIEPTREAELRAALGR